MTTQAAAEPEHYRLDAAASTFKVQAFAGGLLSAFGHDPVFGVNDFQGEVQFVAGSFANASLKLVVKANSLAVVNDIKGKDRQDIERTMRNDVLETAKYPEIVFESNNVAVSRAANDRFRARMIGNLTLHGVTQKNISLNCDVTLTAEGVRAKGGFALRQTDYNIKLVSVAGGTLKIKNEVKGAFDILARRAQ